MSIYIAPDGGYPRYIGDVQLEHPEFDGNDLPEGWKKVHPSTPPVVGEGYSLAQLPPTEIDGVMYQTWTVVAHTPQFLEAQEQHLAPIKEQIEKSKKSKKK